MPSHYRARSLSHDNRVNANMSEATNLGRSRSLAKKDRMASGLDQILFFLVFIAGTVGIIILKYRGVTQAWVTAWPVALMFVYLILVRTSQRFDLSSDRAGDNLYYMGFLFTLVSISYSLYDFSRIGLDQSNDAARSIVVNFGIALATTIVGLALRVTMMQVRGDPAEVERIARVELSQSAAALKTEIDLVIGMLSQTRVASEKAVLDVKTEFKNAAQQVAGDMLSTLDTLKSGATKHNNAAARLVTSIEKLWDRVDKIPVPDDLLSKQLSGPVKSLESAAASLGNVAAKSETVTRSLADAGESMRLNAQKLEESANAISLGSTAFVDLNGKLKETAANFNGVLTTLKDYQQVFSRLGADTETVLAAAKSHRNEILQEVQKASDLLVEFEQSLVLIARGIVEKLNAQ